MKLDAGGSWLTKVRIVETLATNSKTNERCASGTITVVITVLSNVGFASAKSVDTGWEAERLTVQIGSTLYTTNVGVTNKISGTVGIFLANALKSVRRDTFIPFQCVDAHKPSRTILVDDADAPICYTTTGSTITGEAAKLARVSRIFTEALNACLRLARRGIKAFNG